MPSPLAARRSRALPGLGAALLLSLAAPAALAPAPARASIVEALSMRALTLAAEHIALVTVVDLDAHYDAQDRIVTDVTVRVDEALFGPASAGDTLVVQRLGGVVGDLGLRVEGEATFTPGEQVLLFAAALDGVLRPVGMSQGVMPVSRAGGHDVVLPGGAGLALVTPGTGGALVPARPALLAPRSLDAVLGEVRDLVAERPDAP